MLITYYVNKKIYYKNGKIVEDWEARWIKQERKSKRKGKNLIHLDAQVWVQYPLFICHQSHLRVTLSKYYI